MSIKLSIITINFENAIGLKKTILSVINQTNRNFEYIVIDGGSNDGSVELIKEYSNEITFWVSEPDRGIYHAMNKGIKFAKGEYCQFLNSGDFLVASDVIEKMFNSLPDCSIFYGNMLKIMPNGRVYKDTCENTNITMLTFYRGTLNHSPAFIKRSLFNKYGFYDETLKIVSDWKWFLIVIVLNNEPVQYFNLDISCFDMNGISNTCKIDENQERRKVLQDILPIRILADYDAHWQKIEQGNRINRNKTFKMLFWILDRILFKYEKLLKHPLK